MRSQGFEVGVCIDKMANKGFEIHGEGFTCVDTVSNHPTKEIPRFT
ncbi:MAG: hypothetical protein V7K82_13560 [Nostoc sp.]